MVIMEEITEAFDSVQNISIYNGGAVTVYSVGEECFNAVMDGWRTMTAGARQMPAFGVGINELVLNELKNGLWVQFDFGEVFECNEMPFEKLLVEAKREYTGFNLIRYTEERGYDGRCFYLDLDNNMNDFCELLLKYSIN